MHNQKSYPTVESESRNEKQDIDESKIDNMTCRSKSSSSTSRDRYEEFPKKILRVLHDNDNLHYKEGDASISTSAKIPLRYTTHCESVSGENDENSCFSELNCRARFPEWRDREKMIQFSSKKKCDLSTDDTLTFSSARSNVTRRSKSSVKRSKSKSIDRRCNLDSTWTFSTASSITTRRTQNSENNSMDNNIPGMYGLENNIEGCKSNGSLQKFLLISQSLNEADHDKYDCYKSSCAQKYREQINMKHPTKPKNSSIIRKTSLTCIKRSTSDGSSVSKIVESITDDEQRKCIMSVFSAVQILIYSNDCKVVHDLAQEAMKSILSSHQLFIDEGILRQSIRAAIFVIEYFREASLGMKLDISNFSIDQWKQVIFESVSLARYSQKSTRGYEEIHNAGPKYILLDLFSSSRTWKDNAVVFAAMDAALAICLPELDETSHCLTKDEKKHAQHTILNQLPYTLNEKKPTLELVGKSQPKSKGNARRNNGSETRKFCDIANQISVTIEFLSSCLDEMRDIRRTRYCNKFNRSVDPASDCSSRSLKTNSISKNEVDGFFSSITLRDLESKSEYRKTENLTGTINLRGEPEEEQPKNSISTKSSLVLRASVHRLSSNSIGKVMDDKVEVIMLNP